MALKQIVLRKKIEGLEAQMSALKTRGEELRERRGAMQRREEEIEAALNEVTEETSEDDRKAVEGEAEAWEQDNAALESEEAAHVSETEGLQRQIDDLQAELDELNKRAQEAANVPPDAQGEKRKENNTMEIRKFFGLNHQERDAFIARSDVKDLLQRVRGAIKEKRAVNGADLLIPEVMLGLVRERVQEYSKLLKHVNLQRVGGSARQNVMGVVPEAIWTEACGKLNEIDLSFGSVEVDGYKVGAYIFVCNAVLEDSDINLAATLIEALGKAMGLAVDKAILYGTGTKMPKGIVPALAGGDHAATNVLAISGKTGIELFQAIVEASGAADNDYATGGMFWAMNRKTKTKLMSNAMSFSAAGAIVAGQNNEMPVIGGAIETLGFIPDDVIVGGYGELYLMAERAGMTFATSTEVHFVEDETGFKGTARYDGLPVIEKAFVAIGIGGTKPTATMDFAPDEAN